MRWMNWGNLGIISVMSRHIDIVVVTDARCMHQASHLALVFVQLFVVIVHGGLLLEWGWFLVQIFAKSSYPIAAKDAEYVSLLLSELWRGFSTEFCKFWI